MTSKQNTKRRMTAVLIAVAMASAACGQSSSDNAQNVNGDGGRDAEESFAPETTAAESDDAMEEGDDAMEESLDVEAEERDFGATTTTGVPATTVDAGEFGSERTESTVQADPPRIRPFVSAAQDPLSTFALDVDTGSYSLARNQINNGQRPDRDSVRVEEFVNSFDYNYDDPRRESLGISVDAAPSPFDSDNYLLRVGVQGERVRDDERPTAHLTFVIDTSGSMDTSNRLPLVKQSMQLLVDELEDDDTVAIVTYNNSGDVLLEPTSVRDSDQIIDAIDDLRPGGSTNLEAGLRVGYELARSVNEEGDINRVIVASDGLANAGVTDVNQLGRQIRADADNGIRLMTVGYGLGGFNDETMEQLADQSDGVYAYVDTIVEAEKVFEENLTANLYTIAIDAKIQLEFEADVVDEYRLIGFENRGIRDQDFTNDDVDAGEIGAGHQVTALYEVRLNRGITIDDTSRKLGEVNLRWESPEGEIIEIDETIRLRDFAAKWGETSDEFKLAGTVGIFAELLRESDYAGDIDWDSVENEAKFLADQFNDADVDEFYSLVQKARS